MKKTILFVGFAALALLAGCTKDVMKVNNETKTFVGDQAYVVVKISDVGSTSTKATSPGYQYGSSDEYAINDVSFYFYGDDGVFVAEADANGGGDFAHEGSTDENGNFVDADGNIIANAGEDYVEYDKYTVITLQGLASKSYPTWVVTVINKPTGFTHPNSLEDFATELAGGIKVGDYYTMATSSYVDTDNGYSDAYWFATPVVEENFSLEALSNTSDYPYYQDADGNDVVPINIYVERLASKVTLNTSLTSAGADGTYIYQISNEYGGEADPQTYYVKINGWTLNATAKDSYVVKAIENTTTWTNDYFYSADDTKGTYKTFGDDWNAPSDHRSFWGKSWNYGIGSYLDYPTSSDGYNDDEQSVLNDYLDYTSLLNPSSLGAYLYCGENTNTAGVPDDAPVIYHKESSAITSILVSATLCSDADGTPVTDDGSYWVLCDGVLYSDTDYFDLALTHLATYATYYYDTGETETVENPEWDGEDPDTQYVDVEVYKSIDNTFLTLVNDYDGKVHVALKSDYDETEFYLKGEDGNIFDYPYSATDVNGYLDECFNNNYGSDATAYNGGAMYYNVPIEHLNNDYDETYTDSDGDVLTKVLEANYGVVRNHIYSVSITSVTNIGHGIYDPDEVIVPQPDVKKYSLTAEIHVLSWKVVSQNATL